MNSYPAEREQPFRLSFLTFLIIASSLWCYAVLTTSIDRVEMVNLPILDMLPATYWVGVGMLIVATIVWYFSPETRWYHFLLLLFWTLFIFIGPEMMEVTPRGMDTLDHLVGVTFIDQGRLADYYWYNDWPGFIYLSSFVDKATGVGYLALAKLIAISFHLLRMVFIGYFATHLFKGKKQALLFSVLLIGAFWELSSFDPIPQHLAILIMLPLLTLCFSAGHLDMRRRALIILLFISMVVTHILTPFVVALLIIFFSLMSLTGRHLGYSPSIKGYSLPVLFMVMFIAYIMYTADWVFADAVTAFIGAFQEPLRSLTALIGRSTYLEFAFRLALLFYIILLLWMLIIAARKKFWASGKLARIFPLLCALPLTFIIIPYGGASLPRFYILAIPFIVWFLVRESRHLSRILVTAFLVVLLVLSFAERYATEYTVYVPTEEFAGARFICQKIPLSDTVWEGAWADPLAISRANVLDAPEIIGGDISGWAIPAVPGVHLQAAVESPRTRNFFLAHRTEEQLSATSELLYGMEHNMVYTSGDYHIYYYERK